MCLFLISGCYTEDRVDPNAKLTPIVTTVTSYNTDNTNNNSSSKTDKITYFTANSTNTIDDNYNSYHSSFKLNTSLKTEFPKRKYKLEFFVTRINSPESRKLIHKTNALESDLSSYINYEFNIKFDSISIVQSNYSIQVVVYDSSNTKLLYSSPSSSFYGTSEYISLTSLQLENYATDKTYSISLTSATIESGDDKNHNNIVSNIKSYSVNVEIPKTKDEEVYTVVKYYKILNNTNSNSIADSNYKLYFKSEPSKLSTWTKLSSLYNELKFNYSKTFNITNPASLDYGNYSFLIEVYKSDNDSLLSSSYKILNSVVIESNTEDSRIFSGKFISLTLNEDFDNDTYASSYKLKYIISASDNSKVYHETYFYFEPYITSSNNYYNQNYVKKRGYTGDTITALIPGYSKMPKSYYNLIPKLFILDDDAKSNNANDYKYQISQIDFENESLIYEFKMEDIATDSL